MWVGTKRHKFRPETHLVFFHASSKETTTPKFRRRPKPSEFEIGPPLADSGPTFAPDSVQIAPSSVDTGPDLANFGRGSPNVHRHRQNVDLGPRLATSEQDVDVLKGLNSIKSCPSLGRAWPILGHIKAEVATLAELGRKRQETVRYRNRTKFGQYGPTMAEPARELGQHRSTPAEIARVGGAWFQLFRNFRISRLIGLAKAPNIPSSGPTFPTLRALTPWGRPPLGPRRRNP